MSAALVAPVALALEARSATPEYDLKAAFLFNFAHFVEWPKDAFTDATAPMVIGILGEDPFGPALDEMVANEFAHGRRLVVQRYRTLDDVGTCHILFISPSQGAELPKIFARLGRRRILTVGESKDFAHSGVVAFELVQRRLRLRINLDAAEAAGLVVSSKLLRQAQVVRWKGGRP